MKKRFYIKALALLGTLIVQFIIGPIIFCSTNAYPFQAPENINITSLVKRKSHKHLINTSASSFVYDSLLENKIEESLLQNMKKTRTKKRVREIKIKKNPTPLERNERSANLSHISGSARKIQLYIKNRFLQLMPDGIVNGTVDDLSDYTILQRTTVDVGLIKIQGIASCLFLCMDQCGVVYGSVDFSDDCVFNESIEQHHYNTYSSTYNSNAKRTFYLGLNRHGQPRKIQIPTSRQLGKLSTYTKSLTQTVSQERVDQLIARLYGKNHLRHGLKQLCESGKQLHNQDNFKKRKSKLKCKNNYTNNNKNNNNSNKGNNKRKKKKRKCRANETESDQCIVNHNNSSVINHSKNITLNNHNKKRTAFNASHQHNNQKVCNESREDCQHHHTKKGTKKNSQKKDSGSHLKFNNESINMSKIKVRNKIVGAVKLEDNDQDVVIESDEFKSEENYEDFIPGNTANFIDESDMDDN